jgi:hypothetical protein
MLCRDLPNIYWTLTAAHPMQLLHVPGHAILHPLAWGNPMQASANQMPSLLVIRVHGAIREGYAMAAPLASDHGKAPLDQPNPVDMPRRPALREPFCQNHSCCHLHLDIVEYLGFAGIFRSCPPGSGENPRKPRPMHMHCTQLAQLCLSRSRKARWPGLLRCSEGQQ